ncbi:DUF4270 family protein [Tellurirhabdus bombi]|uniref:DUF4270 family protein n=1 Tax=Tellurirhabdus bombi TaxID=2907205 RepID=UPI001F2D7518|nr:DUF4270 family protein [Tellurirhabdus bombi]
MSRNAIIPSTQGWLANFSKGLSLLIGVVALLTACEEPKEIGLTPTTPVGVLYTDTLTVTRSTILLDSVQTGRNNRLLIGNYSDPTFGKVTAKAFAQFDFGYNNTTIINSVTVDNTAIYDSIRYVSGYVNAYGDTTGTQEIFLHRLTEDLDTTKRYTINNTAAYDPTPLTKISLTSGPNSYTSLVVTKLPDAFGQEILNIFKGKTVTRLDFRKAFKGFAFVPGSGNKSVVSLPTGFSINYVAIYYHKANETTASSLGFSIDPSIYRAAAFTQVTANRAGTKLAGLTTTNPLPASATGGQLFVQNGTGVTTKLAFPTFENLKKQGRIAINRAELTITPKSSASGTFLPFYMALAETSANNRISYTDRNNTRVLHLLQTNTGTFQQISQWFYPEVATYGARTRNAYSYDVTGYFQALLTNFRPNTGLVLVPTAGNASTLIPTTQLGTSYQVETYLNTQLTAAVLDAPESVKLVVFYTLAE